MTTSLGDDELDFELEMMITGCDRRDQYPEWSNSAMREAYRAGYEDGIIELHRSAE